MNGLVRKQMVIADDHLSVRQMMALVFEKTGRWKIAGETECGQAMLGLCRELQPDVVVLEVALAGNAGMKALRTLRTELPKQRVLVYSGSGDDQLMQAALACRPHGYVQKRDSLGMLREALEAVASGCVYFTPVAAQWLCALEHPRKSDRELAEKAGLSLREREVLRCVTEGLSNKECAGRLGISVKTVENHRAHVMAKLGLRDVVGLMRYALKHGLVEV